MKKIGLSYTSQDSTVYDILIDNFGSEDMPRTYLSSANFSNSVSGTSLIAGPAYKQKYQWVISTLVPKETAEAFDEMFQAWDQDRASGLPAACGLVDQTFGPEVTASVIFITPPSYTCLSPRSYLVSFGLQEA